MVDSSSSLLQRIQARLNSNNKENNAIVFEESQEQEEANESESDIDDNITLDECVDVVQRKSQDANSSFTRIVQYSTPKSNNNLKEV